MTIIEPIAASPVAAFRHGLLSGTINRLLREAEDHGITGYERSVYVAQELLKGTDLAQVGYRLLHKPDLAATATTGVTTSYGVYDSLGELTTMSWSTYEDAKDYTNKFGGAVAVIHTVVDGLRPEDFAGPAPSGVQYALVDTVGTLLMDGTNRPKIFTCFSDAERYQDLMDHPDWSVVKRTLGAWEVTTE